MTDYLPENENLFLFPPEFTDSSKYLAILIVSAPQNTNRRMHIRTTFAQNVSHYNTSLYFVIGQSFNQTIVINLAQETQKFNDIILIKNIMDSYLNLTLKSVGMLRIFLKHMRSSVYLKADDDVYLNISKIMIFLKTFSFEEIETLLIGTLLSKLKPQSNRRHKNYSPKYMYSRYYYPDFLAGPAYMMSRNVATKLYETALKTPYYHLEDVFLTGICARIARIVPNNNANFSRGGKKICRFKDKFSIHGYSGIKLRLASQILARVDRYCKYNMELIL